MSERESIHSNFSTVAVLSIIIGTLVLLENFGIIRGITRLWPIVILILGTGMILLYKKIKNKNLAILGIGIFLAEISLLFLFCSLKSWNILSSFWPFFIAFIGISGIITSFSATKNRPFLFISGLFFLFLGLSFLLVFAIETKFWPISIVLFGIWLFSFKLMEDDNE